MYEQCIGVGHKEEILASENKRISLGTVGMLRRSVLAKISTDERKCVRFMIRPKHNSARRYMNLVGGVSHSILTVTGCATRVNLKEEKAPRGGCGTSATRYFSIPHFTKMDEPPSPLTAIQHGSFDADDNRPNDNAKARETTEATIADDEEAMDQAQDPEDERTAEAPVDATNAHGRENTHTLGETREHTQTSTGDDQGEHVMDTTADPSQGEPYRFFTYPYKRGSDIDGSWDELVDGPVPSTHVGLERLARHKQGMLSINEAEYHATLIGKPGEIHRVHKLMCDGEIEHEEEPISSKGGRPADGEQDDETHTPAYRSDVHEMRKQCARVNARVRHLLERLRDMQAEFVTPDMYQEKGSGRHPQTVGEFIVGAWSNGMLAHEELEFISITSVYPKENYEKTLEKMLEKALARTKRIEGMTRERQLQEQGRCDELNQAKQMREQEAREQKKKEDDIRREAERKQREEQRERERAEQERIKRGKEARWRAENEARARAQHEENARIREETRARAQRETVNRQRFMRENEEQARREILENQGGDDDDLVWTGMRPHVGASNATPHIPPGGHPPRGGGQAPAPLSQMAGEMPPWTVHLLQSLQAQNTAMQQTVATLVKQNETLVEELKKAMPRGNETPQGGRTEETQRVSGNSERTSQPSARASKYSVRAEDMYDGESCVARWWDKLWNNIAILDNLTAEDVMNVLPKLLVAKVRDAYVPCAREFTRPEQARDWLLRMYQDTVMKVTASTLERTLRQEEGETAVRFIARVIQEIKWCDEPVVQDRGWQYQRIVSGLRTEILKAKMPELRGKSLEEISAALQPTEEAMRQRPPDSGSRTLVPGIDRPYGPNVFALSRGDYRRPVTRGRGRGPSSGGGEDHQSQKTMVKATYMPENPGPGQCYHCGSTEHVYKDCTWWETQCF